MATKKVEGQNVHSAQMDLRQTKITLVGVSPLVTNPFPKKARDEIEAKEHEKTKTTKREKVARNEWNEVYERCYWLSDVPVIKTEEDWNRERVKGTFGVHVGGIKSSATSAAYRAGVVKNVVSANGMFMITNTIQDKLYGVDCIPLILGEPPFMRKDCLSTFNSGASMRYRPQFNDWKIELEVMYNAGLITLDQLFTWFQMGGFSCGLCEYRTEKGGSWGSYIVQDGEQ
jgi:hypothetical protein